MSIERKDIASIREDYVKGELNREDTCQDPIQQFEKWFSEAVKHPAAEPTAMVLSTVGATGMPSSRVVLLKDIKPTGFTFFTNYLSRKGKDIERNQYVSLLFFWHELQRQVRVEGVVSKIPADESTEYFLSRPKESQIGAIASPQSQVIADRSKLEERVKELDRLYQNAEVAERPEHWGGYLVRPDRVEFWQGRANRLHDRIEYVREGENWIKQRLAP